MDWNSQTQSSVEEFKEEHLGYAPEPIMPRQNNFQQPFVPN